MFIMLSINFSLPAITNNNRNVAYLVDNRSKNFILFPMEHQNQKLLDNFHFNNIVTCAMIFMQLIKYHFHYRAKDLKIFLLMCTKIGTVWIRKTQIFSDHQKKQTCALLKQTYAHMHMRCNTPI